MRFGFLRTSDSLPPSIEVAHEGRSFQVRVKSRAQARRISLRVSATTGEAVLTLPERVRFSTAKRFAEAQGGWIAARLARIPAKSAFVDGAAVPIRGEPHRIVHRPGRGVTAATQDENGGFVLAVYGDTAHLARRVKDFLIREARRDLGSAVEGYALALDVRAKKMTLRDTRSRWGSCTVKGHLNFSWRLILAPSFVLDYLAAHEATHLREMNHSLRFWRLLGIICPRTDEAEAWLKRHGAALHRYG